MKKLLAVAIALALALSFAACGGSGGKLSGKYMHESGMFTYEFSGDKFTVVFDGEAVTGKFEAKDGMITFLLEEDDFYTVGFLVPDGPTPYELDGKILIIDEETFQKE